MQLVQQMCSRWLHAFDKNEPGDNCCNYCFSKWQKKLLFDHKETIQFSQPINSTPDVTAARVVSPRSKGGRKALPGTKWLLLSEQKIGAPTEQPGGALYIIPIRAINKA
jgi:hypothetical protein